VFAGRIVELHSKHGVGIFRSARRGARPPYTIAQSRGYETDQIRHHPRPSLPCHPRCRHRRQRPPLWGAPRGQTCGRTSGRKRATPRRKPRAPRAPAGPPTLTASELCDAACGAVGASNTESRKVFFVFYCVPGASLGRGAGVASVMGSGCVARVGLAAG
jgi:hypothetical protein